MRIIAEGKIAKMKTHLENPVLYSLPIGAERVDMNPLIGQTIALEYSGDIFCQHCGRKTKKSFGEGFCYPCMTQLAQCDSCIVKPETCHYAQGTCREPQWGETHCMIDHFVYLANSSGLKVGITRHTQVPTRWIDQGAIQALPILRVKNRHLSGLTEVLFKKRVADKTNWRKMLKNEVENLDLFAERERLFAEVEDDLAQLSATQGANALFKLDEAKLTEITYPVEVYPQKVTSFNLDKTPKISGKLLGIKGQYLILDGGVINLRKYTSYHLKLGVV